MPNVTEAGLRTPKLPKSGPSPGVPASEKAPLSILLCLPETGNYPDASDSKSPSPSLLSPAGFPSLVFSLPSSHPSPSPGDHSFSLDHYRSLLTGYPCILPSPSQSILHSAAPDNCDHVDSPLAKTLHVTSHCFKLDKMK